jgi:SAM-dependent methyltransferase
MSAVAERDHVRAAYAAFAAFYDDFTAHHRYREWTASLEALARAAGLRGRRLLDAGCGTGKSFLPFLDRGYAVTACDVSPEMLAVAAGKAGDRARLVQADVRRMPVLGEFDLVCCLDDVLNYQLTAAELQAALAGLARNLAPGGVMVFDANTLLAYRTFFASTSVVAAGDRVLIWRGHASPEFGAGDRAEATLEALERGADGWWSSASHRHVQRHHPERLVRSSLAALGLAAEVHGMQTEGSIFAGLRETAHSKALYVVTREDEGR